MSFLQTKCILNHTIIHTEQKLYLQKVLKTKIRFFLYKSQLAIRMISKDKG